MRDKPRQILTVMISFVLLLTTAISAQQLPSGEGGLPQQQQKGSSKQQQLKREFQQINQKLQMIQRKASQDPEIKSQREEFSDLVDKKMIKEDPEIKDAVEERNKLIEKMKKVQKSGNRKEAQKLMKQLRSLKQEIDPVRNKVMKQSELQEKEKALKETILKKMKEVNPKTEQLLTRLSQIAQELRQSGQGQAPGKQMGPSPFGK